uniref:Uncharacterized protein n=1 Tax=Ditylum brightwellii TaxID=49249 RepID=A0A7S4R1D5_9STRA|mmetsp:Transcript_15448/g.22162  ORF Transcript_15448/g.22162 Transcript_15448/m.22162 type:complete len:166 (+) Transcript_15448:83-580(+)
MKTILSLLSVGLSFAFNNKNAPFPIGSRSNASSMESNSNHLNNEKSVRQKYDNVVTFAAASIILTTAALTPGMSLAFPMEQTFMAGDKSDVSFSSIVLSLPSGIGGVALYGGRYTGYSGYSRPTIVLPSAAIIAPPTFMYGSPSLLAPSPVGGFGKLFYCALSSP